jgi:hypothetical protein
LDLKRLSGVLFALALVAASCGGADRNAHGTSRNGQLAACLERHGGERVHSTADLADVPMSHPMVLSDAALASVMFAAVHFDVPGRRDQTRSLVVLDGRIDKWPEQPFIHRVRTDPGGYDAVVLMPATRDDSDKVLWDCQEQVAPGEAFP